MNSDFFIFLLFVLVSVAKYKKSLTPYKSLSDNSVTNSDF